MTERFSYIPYPSKFARAAQTIGILHIDAAENRKFHFIGSSRVGVALTLIKGSIVRQ
jgi:hypothetical protein